MAFESYAERQRREQRSGQPEIYVYDRAPAQLRHQIKVALSEGIGTYNLTDPSGFNDYAPDDTVAYDCWKEIDRACRKEVFPYLKYVDDHDHFMDRVSAAIADIVEIDEWISVVEICCKIMSMLIDKHNVYVNTTDSDAAEGALAEINTRFDQHKVGYQFENGWIIRKDSEFVHVEIIKPALALLTAPEFAKADEDFMTAHTHYRTGKFKDAVNAANRAFESMLKAICDLENWTYSSGDRASELVTLVNTNGLFTHDFDKGFTAYVFMMKTGLPAVRNNAGGHGEGIAANEVTAAIARYAISLTASNLVFLGNSYTAFKAARI